MEQHKVMDLWLRLSREDTEKGESLEHHEARGRAYAQAKGWQIGEVYRLDGFSGKTVMGHPETKRMLQNIKSGKTSGLIFSKLARLARNTRELLEFADIFKEADADLVSLGESIDTSTPAGRLFYTMIAALSQWEREEIASRVQASVPIRAKLGKPLGGAAIYGYSWVDRNFIINEKEAPVRKLIYELFLKLKRKKAVAKELNEMGYRTRGGKLFTDSTVTRLIEDSSAKGVRITNYTAHKGKNLVGFKPQSEWITLPCPAIVTEEVWNEANRLIAEQKKKKKRLGRRSVFLLAGYVYCEPCDKKMYIYHEQPIYVCRTCKTRIQEDDLNEIFHEQLKTFLLTDSDVSSYIEKSDAKLTEKSELLDLQKTEALKLRKRMEDLLNLRLDGEMSKESFAEHYRPMEERLSQIMDQLPELEAEVDFLKIQLMSSEAVLEGAKTLYHQWPSLPLEEKRTIVEIITEKIIIGKEDITFNLSHLPTRTGGNHTPPTSSAANGGTKQQHLRGFKNLGGVYIPLSRFSFSYSLSTIPPLGSL